MNIKIKFIFMSIIVLGLIVNTSSFSDVAFAEKPVKDTAKDTRENAKELREESREDAKELREESREDAKELREESREDAKELREESREDAKELREDIQDFRNAAVVDSSSSSSTEKVTICHIPPGNPGNAHTITVGSPAVRAHEAHGDFVDGSCESTDFEEFKDNIDENESEATDSNENLIENLQRQIDNLQKMLQNLLNL